MPKNNKRIVIRKYCLHFHVLTLVIEMVNGWTNVSCVRNQDGEDAQYFIFLTLFGELNLIMVTLANFGVILWAKSVCMKHSSHRSGESVVNLCEPATKLFGLMRNSWWRRCQLKLLDFAHENLPNNSTCDHTFVAVCAYSIQQKKETPTGLE